MRFAFFTRSSRKVERDLTRLLIAPGVIRQHLGDVTALVDLRRGQYFTVNEMGGLVWELLSHDDTRSPDELDAGADSTNGVLDSIASQIADAYGVPCERVRPDVARFLRELVAAGLATSTSERCER
jgi:hypothetical protein